MAARRYEISLLMLKQYVTASSKAYPSFSVGLLLIIPLLRKAWTKFLLQVRVNFCFSYKIMHAQPYSAPYRKYVGYMHAVSICKGC